MRLSIRATFVTPFHCATASTPLLIEFSNAIPACSTVTPCFVIFLNPRSAPHFRRFFENALMSISPTSALDSANAAGKSLIRRQFTKSINRAVTTDALLSLSSLSSFERAVTALRCSFLFAVFVSRSRRRRNRASSFAFLLIDLCVGFKSVFATP